MSLSDDFYRKFIDLKKRNEVLNELRSYGISEIKFTDGSILNTAPEPLPVLTRFGTADDA